MNTTSLCFFIGICLVAICPVSNGARRSRYLLQWNKYDFVKHWDAISSMTIFIEKNGLISSELVLTQPLDEVWLKTSIIVPRPVQQTKMLLMESEFEICQFLREGNMKNKIGLYVFQNMVKNSNFPKQCPISKGLLYFHNIDGLDQFPAFLPESNFTIRMRFHRPNTTDSVNVTLDGTVIEKNNARYKIWV
ncbi:GH22117 [Drosophila grimshawi]|uniref:GH22117 n=1 Tax=Drosophila grimshawi TaxID=7222 RepID=B4J472_DROGR|nr:GH22117 [Drosophila grimshawi]